MKNFLARSPSLATYVALTYAAFLVPFLLLSLLIREAFGNYNYRTIREYDIQILLIVTGLSAAFSVFILKRYMQAASKFGRQTLITISNLSTEQVEQFIRIWLVCSLFLLVYVSYYLFDQSSSWDRRRIEFWLKFASAIAFIPLATMCAAHLVAWTWKGKSQVD